MEKAPPMMYDQILSLARDNDGPTIRELCRLGCPPSFANRVGQTALHIAGIWGSIDAAKTLLECKADPNAQNSLRGSTPFHAAAMGKGPPERRAECVRLMKAAGGNPMKPDSGGELPMDLADDECVRIALGAAPLIFHKAVQAKSASALTDAMRDARSGACQLTVDTPNAKGDTPLHAAVEIGWREGIERLIAARADVATQNDNRQSPLHLAVISGDHRLARSLISAKADANVQDRDKDADPRFSSTTFDQDSMVHRSPLHYAAEFGNVLTAKCLLEAAADPNIQDSKQQTPLHLCIANLRGDEVKIDRGYGVRIHGLQKRPEWNDCVASVFGPLSMSTEEKGYPSSASGTGRWPVLMDGEASEGVLLKEDNLKLLGNEMLDLLLESGADVNLGNQVMGETRTLLHEAARAGDVALIKRVIAARADIDQKDSKLGLTALHLAARSRGPSRDEIVRVLTSAGADIRAVSSSGKTAEELAKTNGASLETLAILRGEAPSKDAVEQKSEQPQTLETLTPEQRALLFLD